ncbi:MAG TPA: co-chaperone GroES [bacterium]|nr:co-chaperone GroES [bacterium]HNZ73438.1 co-chaperone GroES [bacterium]HOH66880.1 co-chaperone GroES [bacterium]HQA63594.1 co-chaperone GroES [bacterium]
MSIKPIGDRVLVKPVAEEEVTKSGIVLPDTIDKEKKAEGELVAVGAGEKVSQLGLVAGQKVLFGKYAGEEIKVGDDEYKILSHDEILAIIE